MASNPFDNFKNASTVFNETSLGVKMDLLKQCSNREPKSVSILKHYHDALLFTLAYPESESLKQSADAEMNRLSDLIIRSGKSLQNKLTLSGIANTQTDGAFSLSLTQWLLDTYGADVKLHSFDNEGTHPKENFKNIFSEMEFETLSDETTKSQEWISNVSGLKNKHLQLKWIVNQISNSKLSDSLKDHLFESMKPYITIKGSNSNFSRTFGKLNGVNTFYHTSGLIKKFDEQSLINKKLPNQKLLSNRGAKEIIDVSRTALALLNRETDPITYCNEDGLMFFELEHGISIALFSMLPSRRLPLESYIGFMMFKNGYPMAYGGGWLFGSRSLLGINIFEAFRGGESAFVFAQLLRTYKNAFGATVFEVEPYQFGKDNPEGLKSGAFWFYYRFGFRPMKKELQDLATSEADKIKNSRTYRSSIDTLKKFTPGNLSVSFNKNEVALNPSAISKFITNEIQVKFSGDRHLARKQCKKQMCLYLNLKSEFQKKNAIGINKLAEFIALCVDTKQLNKDVKQTFVQLIVAKSNSEFEYIQHLRKLKLKQILSKDCLKFISYL